MYFRHRMEAITVLKRALEVMDGGKAWTKGRLVERVGDRDCYCLQGALDRAWEINRTEKVCNSFDEEISHGLMLDKIYKVLHSRFFGKQERFWQRTSIPTFNDHPETTYKDVEEVVKEAIKSLEKWEG